MKDLRDYALITIAVAIWSILFCGWVISLPITITIPDPATLNCVTLNEETNDILRGIRDALQDIQESLN